MTLFATRSSAIFIPRRLAAIVVVMLFLYIVIGGFLRQLMSANASSDDPENYSQEEPHPAVVMLYRDQIKERIELMKQVPNKTGNHAFKEFYNGLVPEVFCRDLVRIGSVGDGGKWICNPHRMKRMDKCTVYSLGMNNDVSFDKSFQAYTDKRCALRCFDKDEQTPETLQEIRNSNGVFMRALISSQSNAAEMEYSFSDLLHKFGDRRIDILKVDIEEAEFLIEDQFLAVPICQLLIEVHPKNPLQALNFLRKLSSHGFYLFSYEVNGGWHHLCEYSFIHEKCFADYGVKTVYGKYLSG